MCRERVENMLCIENYMCRISVENADRECSIYIHLLLYSAKCLCVLYKARNRNCYTALIVIQSEESKSQSDSIDSSLWDFDSSLWEGVLVFNFFFFGLCHFNRIPAPGSAGEPSNKSEILATK